MKLIDEMLTVPERETSGTTALDRFDYQTAWGLAKVMKLHRGDTEYAVAFEFHDDIVELDDADDPALATFYQLKTLKSGAWTLKKIVYRESSGGGKSRKPSFAGKMFDNVKRFGSSVDRLVFVSNQACSELGDDYKDFPFISAPKEKLAEFTIAMKAEDAGFQDAHVPLFYFSYSDLSLGSYGRTLMADVAEFVRDELGLEDVNSRTFGLMLVDECRKRSKRLADLADFTALKGAKLITRNDMNGWLAVLKGRHTQRAICPSV